MIKKEIAPDTVFVHDAARNDAITKRVLSRLVDAKIIALSEFGDPLSELGKSSLAPSSNEMFSEGKKKLLLTHYRGSWLKSCPGTSDHVCCNLWIVNPGEGCPLDCTYCYLQHYLKRNPTLKIYTNIDDLLLEIETIAAKQPDRLFRVGTGEVIDSLVWDSLTDLTLDLVPFFAKHDNLVLELKTKTDNVDNLLSLRGEHRGKTVVSWSVNAKSVTENDEAHACSLAKRIDAACKVVEAGYRVGFHFDPVIHFEGWEDEYLETIKYIFSRVSPQNVAWVSIGTLRYKQEMQSIMMDRFPESRLPFGEQFLASDNKLRYFQPLRFRLINFVWNELKSVSTEMPVYMCMESSTAWREIAGGRPTAGNELVEIFSRRGKLPIVERTVS